MLQRLVLRDYRNLAALDVVVPPGGFVVVGENGHGKTNLLEAVSYLGLFRSVRGARDADVVRFGAPAFYVRGHVADWARAESVSVGYERSTKRKKATIDGVEQARLSEALGALPSVCFSPVDVALVAGGPGERRHFLDVTLALSVPRYLHALQHYRGALRQRNAALKLAQRTGARAGSRGVGDLDARIAVWEPSLVKHGAVLAAVRRAWCDARAERFSRTCAAIGERAPVLMRYAGAEVPVDGGTVAEYEQAYAAAYTRAYEEHRPSELRRGVTLAGPHRDDLQLLLGGRELRTFGSAGQQRTAAIALRMLELATIRDTIGTPPLLLLDDPFAELDAKRSARILVLLEEAGVGQTLLAVPREEDIPAAFTRLERRVMENGGLRG